MEVILAQKKELFFNNLLLLGLDRLQLEKKYGIPFHKEMFVFANKKGYEVVTHFLFSKLSAVTSKDYDVPWPLINKEIERIFQKTCHSHFINFAQENCVRFPRIVPSLITSFGGFRFYELYLSFSCYVLYKTIQRNGHVQFLSRPKLSQQNFGIVKKILQLSTIQRVSKFTDAEKVTASSHAMWAKLTKNLLECLQKLKLLLKDNEELVSKKKRELAILYSLDQECKLNYAEIVEQILKQSKPLLNKIKKLEEFFLTEKKLWKYLESEVSNSKEHLILDGQKFNICISDLPEEFLRKLEKIDFLTSKENGKLSVIRFLKLLMIYFEFIAEVLREGGIDKLHESLFTEDASSVTDTLRSVTSLNKMLSEELIPDMEKNIDRLKLMPCYEENSSESSDSSTYLFTSMLPLQSFNEGAVKCRVPHLKVTDILKSELSVPESIEPVVDDLAISNVHMNSVTVLSSNSFSSEESTIPNNWMGSEFTFSSSHSSETSNETISEVFYPAQHKVPMQEGIPSCSKIDISSLNDIDFAPATRFKMRKSWLQEECLNSVTLPDMPFDISFDD